MNTLYPVPLITKLLRELDLLKKRNWMTEFIELLLKSCNIDSNKLVIELEKIKVISKNVYKNKNDWFNIHLIKL